jgi:TetR/AcrR family transcriptional regulator, transcriptional repressor for nem operon
MLRQWEAEQDTPAGRIRCYINIVITNEADIESYGCPVGTLMAELSKLGPAPWRAPPRYSRCSGPGSASSSPRSAAEDADELAMHVLAAARASR